MNNKTSNEETGHEAGPFPIFKTAAYLTLLFMVLGFLAFMLKGGWLLILMLFIGDYCC